MSDRLSAQDQQRLRNLLGKLRTETRQREYFRLEPATLRWAASGAVVEPDALNTIRRVLEETKHA